MSAQQSTQRARLRPGSLRAFLVGLGKRFRWLAELTRSPLSLLGTLVVLFFLFLAFFGERVAPYPYDADAITTNGELLPRQEPDCYAENPINVPIVGWDIVYFDPLNQPCEIPFGTTRAGRDVYSRVILGTQEIFRLAGIGTFIAVVIGTFVGLVMGYQGGIFDEFMGRVLDTLLAIPALLLALILIGTLPDELGYNFPDITGFFLNPIPSSTLLATPEIALIHAATTLTRNLGDFPMYAGIYNLRQNSIMVVLAVVYSPIVARVVRSSVLSVKSRGFVEAAQLRGESRLYILFREILPSVIPALVVEASLRFSYGIFLVASLGFLGQGADPPTPNWGLMVSEAYQTQEYAAGRTWTLVYPALAIVLLVISVNLMSDGIRRVVQRSE
jgi:peptide/nickel transport system permease protein